MALLFMDGFDHYATADITKKWTSISGSVGIGTTSGRRSTGGMDIASTARSATKSLGSSYATLVVGFAFTTTGPSANLLLSLIDTATDQVQIWITSDLKFEVMSNGVSRGKSTIGFQPGGYNYIEFKSTINNTTGTAVVRLNGAEILNLSNIDTQATANATANAIKITGNSIFAIDDLYVCDTSGSAPQNDFLGDVRIDTVLPNGNGNYSQFDGSDGNSTDNYLLVDETAPNTTDYTFSDVVAEKDSYQHASVAAITSQTIFGVQVNIAALKDDAGARSLKVGVRSGSTDSVDAGTALPTTQTYLRNIFPTDPNTAAAWTETNVNAVESLVEIA